MKTALVTGANRGLGLEFTRQLANSGYKVIACVRNISSAEALNQLAHMHEHVTLESLDVSDPQSILALSEKLHDESIDLLVNNAGTSGESGVTVGNIDKQNFLDVFAVNCYGVVKTTELLLPQLEKSKDKQVLVVSSRMGSISDNEKGSSYAYRASKAALNAAMRSFAIDAYDKGIKIMLIHPGWVKTDMGGDQGLIDTPESVTGMLRQLEAHGDSSHAEVIRRFDGDTIGW